MTRTSIRYRRGFTLQELLVVIAIVAVLVTILVPVIGNAVMRARIVRAHVELRGITQAVNSYRREHGDRIPPTRFSCSSRTAYELPIELGPYLPTGRKNDVDIVQMTGPFVGEEGYRYRAVGPAIINESTLLPDAATLWVPNDFPSCRSDAGRYCNNPETSPVRYAVWSTGPDPHSEKFDIPGRLPVPRKYWLEDASDTGVIVRMETLTGCIYTSP